MAAIKHLLVIKATPDVVYDAITTQKGLAGWWTVKSTSEEKVGGMNTFAFSAEYYNEMKVLQMTPNTLVEWECLVGDKEWIGTHLYFNLEEKDGTTILRFSHEDWANETDFFGNCNFHWGIYLRSLKTLSETGKGMPFSE